MELQTIELETPRLLLRPWREEAAEALDAYAKDPAVGPAAGWPPHTRVENSREIILTVLSEPITWAVVLKETDLPVGSFGLMIGDNSHLNLPETEAEIGYWIGRPCWGQGLIPEAMRRVQCYAFGELRMERLWCGYFAGNEKSKRVQEKCGFAYHHTIPELDCPLIGEVRTEHITTLAKAEWEAQRQEA